LPRAFSSNTSISGALVFSQRQLRECRCVAGKYVIDISGDGQNNSAHSPFVSLWNSLKLAREAVLSEGTIINGLPIFMPRGEIFHPGVNIEEYYRAYVIGGPGAFVIPVRDPDDLDAFTTAIMSKLVREVSMR
jgi:hypothetical protein